MKKVLAAALAIVGAVWFTAQAPANAAPRNDAITTATQTDLSARRIYRRYYRRHYRAVRVYSYPYSRPYPYGYYGPTYYDRPYRRPAPFFFGLGGHW